MPKKPTVHRKLVSGYSEACEQGNMILTVSVFLEGTVRVGRRVDSYAGYCPCKDSLAGNVDTLAIVPLCYHSCQGAR